MRNLEQIRAAHALDATKRDANHVRVKDKGVTRLPAMIVNNGLLAAAAFVTDKSDETGTQMLAAMDAVARHLRKVGRLATAADTKGMIEELCGKNSNSSMLRLATDEALAYLAYLKRFAEKAAENRGERGTST